MELVHIRVWITILATSIAILFAIVTYLFPNQASILLTIEVILLPAIYIVGNYFAENIIEGRYQDQLGIIDKESRAMKDKVIELTYENQFLKNGGKNGKKKS